jgi:hypothetical protein
MVALHLGCQSLRTGESKLVNKHCPFSDLQLIFQVNRWWYESDDFAIHHVGNVQIALPQSGWKVTLI